MHPRLMTYEYAEAPETEVDGRYFVPAHGVMFCFAVTCATTAPKHPYLPILQSREIEQEKAKSWTIVSVHQNIAALLSCIRYITVLGPVGCAYQSCRFDVSASSSVLK